MTKLKNNVRMRLAKQMRFNLLRKAGKVGDVVTTSVKLESVFIFIFIFRFKFKHGPYFENNF